MHDPLCCDAKCAAVLFWPSYHLSLSHGVRFTGSIARTLSVLFNYHVLVNTATPVSYEALWLSEPTVTKLDLNVVFSYLMRVRADVQWNKAIVSPSSSHTSSFFVLLKHVVTILSLRTFVVLTAYNFRKWHAPWDFSHTFCIDSLRGRIFRVFSDVGLVADSFIVCDASPRTDLRV